MDFDWTTFILEIINFLILVWILKRFLYQPVLDVIARRRMGIEKALADAHRIEAEASELKQKNEQRLIEWEAEKEAAQARLMAELAAIRERKMAELEAKIAEEVERRRVLNERARLDFEYMMEEKGIAQGALFSTKLLSRLASPELEAQLYALLLEDLHRLGKENKRAVTEAAAVPGLQIKVQSAFPLEHNKQAELSHSLAEVIGRMLPTRYEINPELIAGFQIEIGPWIFHANLHNELKFFSGALQHA
ncbi:ATP synthase F0 subcomplex B subunit [Nitrosomonas cryotolerans]|uniref:ATP synthase subunit b n=1 Tax=Nitrosomonas cryotolerans ATCC 49181 TaxID=1131553 RepID=A0A1N6HS75_9PROT|nr:F0F1 ATP synthase subunit delta [Nitrosomonas cryotolerans]SFP95643.1 ATP synthase F0 subcomplex B subunit [Nitrosomonas cryotolerans]SIO22586.1 F-type H+-transporting ATPase subunit b [Nitrosomonas cryotolerans ATCC 49181]